VKWKTKKGTYGCASEDMAMVKVSEGLNDEFGREVLNGDLHVLGGGFWDLEDEIRRSWM
jgi:hypothetical protein